MKTSFYQQAVITMSLTCTCPVGAEIPDLTISTCPVDLGQIQKVIFQRRYSTGTTLNQFTIASANPNLLASWTAVTSASDGTKAVVSPYISNPTVEEGAKREFGGGNATVGGIPINLGRESTTFTSELLRVSHVMVKQLKGYECEDLGVYLIGEDGKITGLADDNSSATQFRPIPVTGFFVSDRRIGGYENPDVNVLSWSFLPNWSDELYTVTPSDFNALTQL